MTGTTDPEHAPGAAERATAERLWALPAEPSLRAALLALGVGIVWAALSRWRQRRPSDLW